MKKEYEKCEMCGEPITTNDPRLCTFQVCSRQCLEELTGLIMPSTSPNTHNVYRENNEE